MYFPGLSPHLLLFHNQTYFAFVKLPVACIVQGLLNHQLADICLCSEFSRIMRMSFANFDVKAEAICVSCLSI